jgi:hypothetical protein
MNVEVLWMKWLKCCNLLLHKVSYYSRRYCLHVC